MAEVFAGFVCGYALALIVTPALAIALVRARTNSAYLERLMPPGTNVVALSIVLHGFAFLAFTAIGMVLGLTLVGIEDRRPDSGLGSPNAVFTALMLAVTATAVLPFALVLPRWRVPLLASGVVFAALFGYAMPYLSLAGPDA